MSHTCCASWALRSPLIRGPRLQVGNSLGPPKIRWCLQRRLEPLGAAVVRAREARIQPPRRSYSAATYHGSAGLNSVRQASPSLGKERIAIPLEDEHVNCSDVRRGGVAEPKQARMRLLGIKANTLLPSSPGASLHQSLSDFWWGTRDNWCSLCKEPHNELNEHRGKREHICMMMVIDAMMGMSPPVSFSFLPLSAIRSAGKKRHAQFEVTERSGSWRCRLQARCSTEALASDIFQPASLPQGQANYWPLVCIRPWSPPLVWAEFERNALRSRLKSTYGRSCRWKGWPLAPSVPHRGTGSPGYGVRFVSSADAEENEDDLTRMVLYHPSLQPSDTDGTRELQEKRRRAGGPVVSLRCMMEKYDLANELPRRQELFLCLQYLISKKLVSVKRPHLTTSSFVGSSVLFKDLFPAIAVMFPMGDAKDISALTQMTSAIYNCETIFDLCGFRYLLPPDGGERGGGRRGDEGEYGASGSEAEEAEYPTGHTTALHDPAAFASSQRRKTTPPPSASPRSGPAAVSTGDHTFHLKGTFCRAVLGQLRWAGEPDTVLCPFPDAPLYDRIIAEHTCQLLVAEITSCKVLEYVTRVEGVWRQQTFYSASDHTVVGGPERSDTASVSPPRGRHDFDAKAVGRLSVTESARKGWAHGAGSSAPRESSDRRSGGHGNDRHATRYARWMRKAQKRERRRLQRIRELQILGLSSERQEAPLPSFQLRSGALATLQHEYFNSQLRAFVTNITERSASTEAYSSPQRGPEAVVANGNSTEERLPCAPLLPNWGALQQMENYFYDTDFGEGRKQEMRHVRRGGMGKYTGAIG